MPTIGMGAGPLKMSAVILAVFSFNIMANAAKTPVPCGRVSENGTTWEISNDCLATCSTKSCA